MKNKKLDNFNRQVERTLRLKPFIRIKEFALICVGLLPYSLAVNQMLVPHDLVSGGLTGFCEILYFATDRALPIWLTTLVINLLLLAVAWKLVGKAFCLKTLYGVACLTMWLKVIPIPTEPLVHDPFMACILGGVMCGCGLGVLFLNNGSSGGTDIIAAIVSKYRHMPMGRILFYCDLVIIGSAYFLPNIHSFEKILFGLCFTFMSSNVVDMIMNKVRQSVQFFIFSQYYDAIADAINTKVRRGVTVLDGEGWYSKEPMHVVTVLAKKSESKQIFSLVREIDPNAFVSQSQVIGVYGQGFEAMQK